MTSFKDAIFKIGTKDGKVYFELWNADDTARIVDAGELTPETAYNIGKAFMDKAIEQGYKPDTARAGDPK